MSPSDARREPRDAGLVPRLAESLPLGLAVVARGGVLRWANRALARVLGCRDVAHLLSVPLIRFHDMPELAVDILRDRVEDDGRIRGAELELRRLDGETVVVRIHALLAGGDDDDPVAYCSVEDVTAARGEREQSLHGRKMDAVARFAAGIAHDYNNLLTAIIGEAREILDDTGDEAVAGPARAILDAARGAADITRRLLVLSRAELFRTDTLPMDDAVAAARPAVEALLPGDIDLEWRLEAGGARLSMDGDHLREILTALVSNARDALPAGGRVVVETGLFEAPGDTEGMEFDPPVPPGRYVGVAVGDNGIGMNAETRRQIFDPFFTTKGLGHGTGLGLTTVYGLMRQAGGHVSVLSAPAYGTLVRLLFPVVSADGTGAHVRGSGSSAQAGAESRGTEAPPPAGDGGGPVLVLVVDDEPSVRRVLGKILRRAGFEVEEAADARRAREVLERRSVDLLVTDIMMPDELGTDLARWTRRHHPDVRILLVSGYTDTPEARAWLEEDPDSVLPKPFEPHELEARIRRRLADRLPRRATAG